MTHMLVSSLLHVTLLQIFAFPGVSFFFFHLDIGSLSRSFFLFFFLLFSWKSILKYIQHLEQITRPDIKSDKENDVDTKKCYE